MVSDSIFLNIMNVKKLIVIFAILAYEIVDELMTVFEE